MNQRRTNILFILNLLLPCFFIAQNPIILSEYVYNKAIQSNSVVHSFPKAEAIDLRKFYRSYQAGQFKSAEMIDGIPKFNFQQINLCYVFILKNQSSETKNLILRSKHSPLKIALKKDTTFENIQFTGHGAEHDPNGIIPIKTRNSATFGIPPFSQDTLFYVTQIIEAGESKAFLLSDVNLYTTNTLSNNQIITLFNGLFLGILIVFLFSTLYFYIRIREKFLLWYIAYLSIFLFYYWRDLELWIEQLDLSHQAIPWLWTKGPITYFIFLFYLFFIKHILVKDEKSIISKFLKYSISALPLILLIDIILTNTWPYSSIAFTYTFGVLVGCIQFGLLVPIWKTKSDDRTSLLLVIGSICIFLGWLTIIFFDVSIHQYTVRIFTLIELIFFTLAIVEQFLKIKNEKEKAEILRIQALNQERSRISAVLHDELGASVSGVSMFSFLASQQLKSSNIEAADHTLKNIQSHTHEIVEKLQDIIWLTGSQHESLDTLFVKLEDYLVHIAATKKIKHKITIPHDETNKIILKENISRNIYLICREAIHNSIKYAEASQIEMYVSLNKDSLHVKITDNGIGFDQTKMTYGNGIKNMKTRAEEINSVFEITSQPNMGTECVLRINKLIGLTE